MSLCVRTNSGSESWESDDTSLELSSPFRVDVGEFLLLVRLFERLSIDRGLSGHQCLMVHVISIASSNLGFVVKGDFLTRCSVVIDTSKSVNHSIIDARRSFHNKHDLHRRLIGHSQTSRQRNESWCYKFRRHRNEVGYCCSTQPEQ